MTKNRWIALLSVLGIVIAAVLTTAAVTRGGGSPRTDDDSPLLAPSTTATTIPRTSTTHAPAPPTTAVLTKLPQPAPPPADPYAATPIVQIGSIEIPKIGLLHPIYEGITLTVIDHGPGHWPGSAQPCQAGNTVFPGHRVTHTHPFLNLDQLAAGDQIVFHMPGRDCVYKVTTTQIVVPTDLYVTYPTRSPTVTLIACHPKHSAAQRIVVKGILVADIPRPA
jgi:sortase A